MKDRVPLYPGRVKLTPVSGQENTYDMVRADEPTQEGDQLGKATFLKDTTATLLGGDSDMLPDGALVALKNLSDKNAKAISKNSEALIVLKNLINKNAEAISANTTLANTKAKFITGSYTGTGTNSTTVTITFPSLPKILFVYSKVAVSGNQYSNFVVFPGYGGFGTSEVRGDAATYAVTIYSTVQGNSITLQGASRYDFNAAVEYGYISIV